MDVIRYLSLLVVFFIELAESGGHEKSHDHLKIYVPEIHHHKHHTKYITIHHHHKKPKKEHHHHHHHHKPHHHKPHHPHHHYYHHTKKGHKTKHKTVTSHHGHGHHGHGHKHHGHHHKHGHGHGHHHHDSPSYDPPVTYDINYPALDHAAPQVPSIPHIPFGPKVKGVTHTVQQVTIHDSLPGVVPGGNIGYEVTEKVESDNGFNAFDDLHNVYPSTFNFLRSAAPEQQPHDHFGPTLVQTPLVNNHDPFAPAHNPPTAGATAFGQVGNQNEIFTSVPKNVNFQPNIYAETGRQHDPFAPVTSNGDNDIFTSVPKNAVQPNLYAETGGQHDPFAPVTSNGEIQPNDEGIPMVLTVVSEQDPGYDNANNSFVSSGIGITNEVPLTAAAPIDNEEIPVSFSREAGIQKSVVTSGQNSVVY